MHPGKTFYVIRDLPNYVGVAGWFDAVLGYMLYADKKGWIPVVDPPPPAQTDDGDWSAYFAGPNAEYWPQLKELANVVVAHPRGLIHKRYNRNNVARRHAILPRVPFTDELQSFVDDGLAKLFAGAPEGMVGVRFRGTDYRCHGTYRPTGHATVPTIEYFCQELERSLRKWGLRDVAGEHLLIVTEEQEAMDELRKRYPKCRFVEKERYANFDFKKYLCFHRLPTLTPKQNNFMYMLEVSALARCEYLFGGRNGGVLMALNLNGNRYKGVRVLETGVS